MEQTMETMEQTMESFANIALKEKVEVVKREGLYLSYENGSVKYERFGETKEAYDAQIAKEETVPEYDEELNNAMYMAIYKMEIRRQNYREKDLEDYGYDKYLEEYEYEPEESDDESDEVKS